MIVAMGKNRVIGNDNELLWNIPDDLKRFKVLTLGHTVIMGRKTWESLPEKFRPLPGRTNVVISRQKDYAASGATLTDSFAGALAAAASAPGPNEVFIIGGGQLYAETVPFVDRLYLTLIDDEKEGSVYFPPYEDLFTKVLDEESRVWNGLGYRFVTLER